MISKKIIFPIIFALTATVAVGVNRGNTGNNINSQQPNQNITKLLNNHDYNSTILENYIVKISQKYANQDNVFNFEFKDYTVTNIAYIQDSCIYNGDGTYNIDFSGKTNNKLPEPNSSNVELDLRVNPISINNKFNVRNNWDSKLQSALESSMSAGLKYAKENNKFQFLQREFTINNISIDRSSIINNGDLSYDFTLNGDVNETSPKNSAELPMPKVLSLKLHVANSKVTVTKEWNSDIKNPFSKDQAISDALRIANDNTEFRLNTGMRTDTSIYHVSNIELVNAEQNPDSSYDVTLKADSDLPAPYANRKLETTILEAPGIGKTVKPWTSDLQPFQKIQYGGLFYGNEKRKNHKSAGFYLPDGKTLSDISCIEGEHLANSLALDEPDYRNNQFGIKIDSLFTNFNVINYDIGQINEHGIPITYKYMDKYSPIVVDDLNYLYLRTVDNGNDGFPSNFVEIYLSKQSSIKEGQSIDTGLGLSCYYIQQPYDGDFDAVFNMQK